VIKDARPSGLPDNPGGILIDLALAALDLERESGALGIALATAQHGASAEAVGDLVERSVEPLT
jgi:hypothetical protein